MHAASAGLKSFCSTVTANGMEDARKCCGGHGYSLFSGLPEMVANYLLIYTGEGENYLMTYVHRQPALAKVVVAHTCCRRKRDSRLDALQSADDTVPAQAARGGTGVW